MGNPNPGTSTLPLRSFAFMLLSAAVVFFVIGALVLRGPGGGNDSASATASAVDAVGSTASRDGAAGDGGDDAAREEGSTETVAGSESQQHGSDAGAGDDRGTEEDGAPAGSEDDAEADEDEAPATTTELAPPPATATQVHVLNNSTVAGLAARTADALRGSGWQVGTVGNFSDTALGATTVFYGTQAERALAEQIAEQIGARVQARIGALAGQPSGIVVVLTG
ncbi:LytR C-terminal domain-containing protein [Lolliginicoccus suaedae]|uniref:LytR C-terminal domain-containing protein n=1 Tax=Lolliginicoccus suaedae TaxID=2605429 RepID=UPI0011ED9EC2|nr:LytR C-terminal domain-containing protein [Lolliginicoccus suaedae]